MFWRKQKVNEIKYELEILNNNISKKVCCFSGHRPSKLPWGYNENDLKCVSIKKKLYIEIEKTINEGYNIFLCGMALGFDMICAEIVLNLKNKYRDIKLIGALPCKNQDSKWNNEQQRRYRYILSRLDGIRCIYENYIGAECMLERNQFMINNSSKIIALYNGESGGTQRTLLNAKEKGLKINIIKINK